jgi:hypothetical protein
MSKSDGPDYQVRDTDSANLKAAKELYDLVRRVGIKQDVWKTDLERFYRTETEQDQCCRSLTREVLVNEAEALSSGTFMTWMARRQDAGVGNDGINDWFHKDLLTSLTPYAGILPFPRLMSSQGQQMIRETIREMQFAPPFYIQSVPRRVEKQDIVTSFLDGKRTPLNIACLTEEDVLAAAYENHHVVSSLEDVPCLFLNDGVLCGVRFARCFVVGEIFVAAEMTRGPQSPEEDDVVTATLLCRFVEKVSTEMKQRSFVADVLFQAAGGANRCVLLALHNFGAEERDFFSARELALAAQCFHTFRKKGGSTLPVVRYCKPDAAATADGRYDKLVTELRACVVPAAATQHPEEGAGGEYISEALLAVSTAASDSPVSVSEAHHREKKESSPQQVPSTSPGFSGRSVAVVGVLSATVAVAATFLLVGKRR